MRKLREVQGILGGFIHKNKNFISFIVFLMFFQKLMKIY